LQSPPPCLQPLHCQSGFCPSGARSDGFVEKRMPAPCCPGSKLSAAHTCRRLVARARVADHRRVMWRCCSCSCFASADYSADDADTSLFHLPLQVATNIVLHAIPVERKYVQVGIEAAACVVPVFILPRVRVIVLISEARARRATELRPHRELVVLTGCVNVWLQITCKTDRLFRRSREAQPLCS
jgi:hypothetical protein